MTSHKEWFSYLEKPAQPGVVATGDDTPHPIANVGEVPLSHVGQKGKLLNVLHVPTITKNLVSVGQIIDQGMEVRFTHLGCFIEEEGSVIAQGRRDGRMFILAETGGYHDMARLEPMTLCYMGRALNHYTICCNTYDIIFI